MVSLGVCDVVHGFRSLLYPFRWNSPNYFVALLAYKQLDILDSDYPYLCGITREMYELPLVQSHHNFVTVDLDNDLVGVVGFSFLVDCHPDGPFCDFV